MSADSFERVLETLESGGPEAGFEYLAQKFRDEKNYPLLFEARLMKARHELGLPLLDRQATSGLPPDVLRIYDERLREAARETGSLFLADGDIVRAWPYFHAIGDRAPVAEAIERLEPEKGTAQIIEIAYQQAVNPRKGFEMVLANFGICRAIQMFSQYPGREGRDHCIRLLVRSLYADLVQGLKWTIEQREGRAPDSQSVPDLLAGRDWLFEGDSYYVDCSHLISVLRFSLETDDPETLRLAIEMADYGTRLSPTFQYPGDPPFEDVYRDHAIYLRALLGEQIEEAIGHFRSKIEKGDAQSRSAAAQALVALLAHLGRHQQAIELSREHLAGVSRYELSCPSILELCEMAGDYGQLMTFARERGDLLSFLAAAVKAPVAAGGRSGRN